jgi:phospholipid N-methyltransferase
MNALRFLYESFKHPIQIGAFSQSTKYVAQKMAQHLNGSKTVLEFGPGTGNVTRQILKKLPANGQLVCFEINPNFCDSLRAIEDDRLTVINDDASNFENYVDKVDCIISALPLNLLKKSKRDKIIAKSGKSKIFIQLQYTPFLAGKMKQYFDDVKIKFAPLNLPPAFIYVCKLK